MTFFFVSLLDVKVSEEGSRLITLLKYLIVHILHLIKEMGFSVCVDRSCCRPKFTLANIRRKCKIFVLLNLALRLIEIFNIVM